MSARLHHRLDGPEDAPVVVLLNSLGTTLAMWDPQVEALAERFRVLRFDSRGHGRSEVPPGPYAIADLGADALALLDSLGIERAHVCGLSMGGMCAMWLAVNAPERVDRLVLCSTSLHIPSATSWQERADLVRAEGMEAVADGAIDRWFTPSALTRQPEAVERIYQGLLECPTEGYAASCEALRDHDMRGRLTGVVSPTLVLVGGQDPVTPPEHARAIAAEIDGARVDVLDQARHLFTVERPARATRAILAHLDPGDQAAAPVSVI